MPHLSKPLRVEEEAKQVKLQEMHSDGNSMYKGQGRIGLPAHLESGPLIPPLHPLSLPFSLTGPFKEMGPLFLANTGTSGGCIPPSRIHHSWHSKITYCALAHWSAAQSVCWESQLPGAETPLFRLEAPVPRILSHLHSSYGRWAEMDESL